MPPSAPRTRYMYICAALRLARHETPLPLFPRRPTPSHLLPCAALQVSTPPHLPLPGPPPPPAPPYLALATLQGGFHGRTIGTMALTSSKTIYRW